MVSNYRVNGHQTPFLSAFLVVDCRLVSNTLSLLSFSRFSFHCFSNHVSLLRHLLFFIYLAPSPYLYLSISVSYSLCLSLSLSLSRSLSSLFCLLWSISHMLNLNLLFISSHVPSALISGGLVKPRPVVIDSWKAGEAVRIRGRFVSSGKPISTEPLEPQVFAFYK